MNDALRQTGRTTRLIEKAVREAAAGRAVYVLAPTRRLAALLQQRVQVVWDRLWPGRGPHGIKVETPQDVGVFDWWQMRVLASHPNCVWLVDHYLIEQHIEKLQAEMASMAQLVGKLYPLTV